ncbi:MAG: serine protease [Candidatus Obscuribacterales bacterium]|nr:serine protease [Candidatus Obscuribacterales bacterium]
MLANLRSKLPYIAAAALIASGTYVSAGTRTIDTRSGAAVSETWETLDRRLKQQVFQVNVGLKLRLKDGQYVQLSDLSPKYRLPVYTTSPQDRGYRVISFGTAFPVKTAKADAGYFLTSRHVVDKSEPIIKECERFFAAMRLFAEQTAGNRDVEGRYRELQAIVNWSQTKRMNTQEKATYTQVVDAIWDCYETYLSEKTDPLRIMFKRYSQQTVVSETGYFIHPPGPSSLAPLKGYLYRVSAGEQQPDLALLAVKSTIMAAMELDAAAPSEGQEVQVIGYPIASDQIDTDSAEYYTPTFSTGRISRVTPRTLQVDAPIHTGNSGGPVVNLRGKVVGVVARRARDKDGSELPHYGAAVSAQCVRAFAPELFGNVAND